MPWKECRKMDEKLRFVSRFLDGEKIAVGDGLKEIKNSTLYRAVEFG